VLYIFQIFDCIKSDNPGVIKKVKAIAGDVCQDKLGLSEDDERKVTHNIHVIFHVAANVKFDLNLKDAIIMNVEGTQKVLQLATKMTKLQVRLQLGVYFIKI